MKTYHIEIGFEDLFMEIEAETKEEAETIAINKIISNPPEIDRILTELIEED